MRGKSAFWSLNHERLSSLFFLLILFLPTQLGRHFFPFFSFVNGIRIDYLSPTLYFTDVLVFLFLLTSFYHVSCRQFLRKILQKNRVFGIALVACLFLSTLLSHTPLLAIYGSLKLLEYFFLGIVLTWYFEKEEKKALSLLLMALCLGMIFESLLAILQYLRQGSVNGLFYWFGERYFTTLTPGIALASIKGVLLLRPYGTFPHPNVLAAYLLISQTLLLFVRPLDKKRMGIFLLSTTALFLTMSRAALLAWVVILCMFLYQRFPKRWFLFVLLAVPTLFILFPVGQRFFSVGLSDESTATRIVLAAAALRMIQSHVLFGIGLFQFIPSLSAYSLHLSPFLSFQPVHSIFLLIAAELGMSGFLLFLLFLSQVLKTAVVIWKKKSELPLLLLLIYLFLGSVDHYFMTLQQGQLLSALLFSFIFSFPIVFSPEGSGAFDSGLRKNTRNARDYVVDTTSSRHQNRKNIRSARTKR